MCERVCKSKSVVFVCVRGSLSLFHSHSVFYRQHKQIRNIIKLIVLQIVFDSQNLEAYLTRKITQFTSSVQVVDSITTALNSPEVERIIEEKLEILYVQPEGQYLECLGLSKVRLRPLVKPAVLSLYAEAAPLVLDSVTEKNGNQVHVCVCEFVCCVCLMCVHAVTGYKCSTIS